MGIEERLGAVALANESYPQDATSPGPAQLPSSADSKELMEDIKRTLDTIQMTHDDVGNWLRAEQLLERIAKRGVQDSGD